MKGSLGGQYMEVQWEGAIALVKGMYLVVLFDCISSPFPSTIHLDMLT